MIIKSITIENFRSYYGVNTIEIGNHLTLIVGANGDGKTTLFDALEWLFDTTGQYKSDTKYISKKKQMELSAPDSAVVRVSMTYENDGEKIIEKSFRFTKGFDGSVTTSNFKHSRYTMSCGERIEEDGRTFDRDFASSVKKYCLFKGETELNIFNKPESMKYLVETFSEVRAFDPYLAFMEKANEWATAATDHAMKSDKKNAAQAQSLRNQIKDTTTRLGDLEHEYRQKDKDAANFRQLLEDIEKNKEGAQLLKDINDRLQNLERKKREAELKIHENYTVRLLDEMWILMGFPTIAKEFTEKVAAISKARRKAENAFQQEKGAKAIVHTIQDQLGRGVVPLSVHVPDEKTMREMLNDEVCKVCGRPAPKGSEAYNFMQQRLDEYLASLKSVDEEQESLFENDYINELEKQDTILNGYMHMLTKLYRRIQEDVEFNKNRHAEVERYNTNIAHEEEEKKKLLAQTDGLTEDQLQSAYENIQEWWTRRSDAEKSLSILDIQIKNQRERLNALNEDYSKLSMDSAASTYGRTSTAIRKIMEAFVEAKVFNKREFITKLESVSNEYLQLLNKGDFQGEAHIVEMPDDSARIVLVDKDGSRITNPNTALLTTMYMSLLFAVAKLTTIKHENDFPLIFDAPTSSFTTAKESDFFGVIGDIKKQTIIVTKSFLKETEEGQNILDMERIAELNGTVYRIEKMRPFDERDLATIQTKISKIK